MSVVVTAVPDLTDTRLAFILCEERLGHYPEFRNFFATEFDLDRVGLSEPGYVRGPSGAHYALIFLGRSGTSFPSGLELHAVVPGLEPLDEKATDSDVWAILKWMIESVGPPWSVDTLNSVGQLYRVPAATDA